MPTEANPNLLDVDWTKIPAPIDDGAARHLEGMRVPSITLAATDGTSVELAALRGTIVVFAYPRTGVPGQPALVTDWDEIPGARGCTPQSCAFRDLHGELRAAGATHVFGLSTQDTAYQGEASARLHLPFPLLSDARRELASAMRLPTLEVAGQLLLARLALVIAEGTVAKIFYPVFPPDRNARDVLDYLRARP
jgi:peroxiredoxin